MKHYLTVLKKYAEFGGRASRAEYWYFQLFNLIIVYGLLYIEILLEIFPETEECVLVSVYYFLIIIPSTALQWRRMHDVNKPGLYSFIPIYNFVLSVTAGTKGDNKYGADPKATESK